MFINQLFLVILLIISVAIVREKNNNKLIIFFSSFSLIAAGLYFFNNAPDVALAEIAVGSAFVPLIFLITIRKQRTFTVMNTSEKELTFLDVLDKFCKEENLKLKIIKEEDVVADAGRSIQGVFRRQDIDMIVHYNIKKRRFDIRGKKSNIMINKFGNMVKNKHHLRLIRTEDIEMDD